jgi:Carbohydrate family 9 binding domain-like
MLIKSLTSSILLVSLSIGMIVPFKVLAADHPKDVSEVHFADTPIVIDGKNVESDWQKTKWLPLTHHILGEMPTEQDFSGRFKLLWDQHYLYILAEITDDILFDQHPNPLFKYWDDDCLEIFVDEDNSGGEHQFSFNAFAYHVSLDNQAADIGTKQEGGEAPFILLNDHIRSRWQRNSDNEHKITWEVSVKLYDDTFVLGQPNQYPITLTQGKKIGFMLAYCDNDGSAEREHFLGSVPIKPINGDKNLGYKTADVFQTFMLIP